MHSTRASLSPNFAITCLYFTMYVLCRFINFALSAPTQRMGVQLSTCDITADAPTPEPLPTAPPLPPSFSGKSWCPQPAPVSCYLLYNVFMCAALRTTAHSSTMLHPIMFLCDSHSKACFAYQCSCRSLHPGTCFKLSVNV